MTIEEKALKEFCDVLDKYGLCGFAFTAQKLQKDRKVMGFGGVGFETKKDFEELLAQSIAANAPHFGTTPELMLLDVMLMIGGKNFSAEANANG